MRVSTTLRDPCHGVDLAFLRRVRSLLFSSWRIAILVGSLFAFQVTSGATFALNDPDKYTDAVLRKHIDAVLGCCHPGGIGMTPLLIPWLSHRPPAWRGLDRVGVPF
eukprot:TRINITY_DN30153_c0_g1_i1.p1 TRINITY_DN30153_c0_g1~~TRINITY_DN30153_c0_g1_i1.p1  ORF type:complete len:107 (+),score=1.59 TRINITY_DN30153_c0_g1_i1:247-567(+)